MWFICLTIFSIQKNNYYNVNNINNHNHKNNQNQNENENENENKNENKNENENVNGNENENVNEINDQVVFLIFIKFICSLLNYCTLAWSYFLNDKENTIIALFDF